eukprot:TRINITY_DN777_c0_g1_i3.p1 TRINITY_DN777_c0_g1~~TRINITY_DN777_c0_g1_i3.p1  ORF type:complete len:274 (-),score=51.87 TRINITY_DN777_c0_g1_i3:1066-1887(-)
MKPSTGAWLGALMLLIVEFCVAGVEVAAEDDAGDVRAKLESVVAERQTAMLLGHFATICFTLQYIPQAIKNYRRQSVKGFSTTGIIIKLVGAAFLAVNAYILGESAPVVLYGVFNIIQHSIFVVQFALYTKHLSFLPWILFPTIPYVLGTSFPATMPFTNSIKPVAQVLSHFPQLWLCVNLKSISGVSMLTQHLNILGGVSGLLSKMTLNCCIFQQMVVLLSDQSHSAQNLCDILDLSELLLSSIVSLRCWAHLRRLAVIATECKNVSYLWIG